jgi:hypothetical protein
MARYTALHSVVRGNFGIGGRVAEAGSGEAAAGEIFAAEVVRLRASGTLGEAGRLRELFEYLAGRGPEAPPASQADIAAEVFGNDGTDGDDATVRVYIHRLRKRLDDYYQKFGDGAGEARLIIPAGIYALRQEQPREAMPPARLAGGRISGRWLLVLGVVTLSVVAFFAGRGSDEAAGAPQINEIWEPFVESDRPIMVVVGDYYLFGEIDPVRPEEGRLIRDFSINSQVDLARMQETNPARYGVAEDVGLSYLPVSTAEALRALMPVLARSNLPVALAAASDVDAEDLRDHNVVYIGLLSGMGLLEESTFSGSNYTLGMSYDEVIDRDSDRSYISEEGRRLAAPVFYTDYAYFARFDEPGGGHIAVVAGARETGLRAMAAILAKDLPPQLDRLAGARPDKGFEALFEITGQQGANLSQRLVSARARPGR